MKHLKNKTLADPVTSRERRQRNARIRNGILIVLLMAGALALRTRSKEARLLKAAGEGDGKTLMEAVMTSQDMTRTLQSYGTLALAEELNMELPGSILVEKYYVKEGDVVTEGSAIAALDRESVSAAISDVQTMIANLDKNLAEVMDDTIPSSLKASLDGTVVKIYGQAGDSVVDTMYEHEALMLISLDGLLAADITNTGDFTVGDTLTMVSEAGKEAEATVANVTRDTITLTVPMEEFDFQEKVSIQGEKDGKTTVLGSCPLYIYSQQKITGYSGTISSISVKEGSKVSAGKILLKLTDTDYSADAAVLLGQRDTLVEQYNTLIALSRTGVLFAEADGVITSIDEDLLTEKENEQGENEQDKMAKVESKADSSGENASNASSMNLSKAENWNGSSIENWNGSPNGSSNGSPNGSSNGNPNGSLNGSPNGGSIGSMSASHMTCATPVVIRKTSDNSGNTDENDVVGSAPEKDDASSDGWSGGDNNKSEDSASDGESAGSGSGDDDGNDSGSEDGNFSTISKAVEIQWKDSLGNDMAAGMPAIMEITLLADGREVSKQQVSQEENWTYVWEQLPAMSGEVAVSYIIACDIPAGYNGSYKLQGDTMILTFTQISPGQPGYNAGDGGGNGSEDVRPGDNQNSGNSNPGSNNPGSNNIGAGSRPSGGSLHAAFGIGSAGGSASAIAGGNTGSMGGNSSSGINSDGSGKTVTPDSYVMEKTSLISYMPNNQVSITITVDELDIAKITPGMSAQVTLEALPGQSFEGTITEIGEEGSNAGGNTKYTAIVTMDKNEKMLLGMSAYISLPLSEEKNLQTLPAAALIEKGGKTYVYTSYDSKTQQLTSLQEITTGLSDGTNVEITGGLEPEGRAFWFR